MDPYLSIGGGGDHQENLPLDKISPAPLQSQLKLRGNIGPSELAKTTGKYRDIRNDYSFKMKGDQDTYNSLRGKVTPGVGDINTNVLGPYENN